MITTRHRVFYAGRPALCSIIAAFVTASCFVISCRLRIVYVSEHVLSCILILDKIRNIADILALARKRISSYSVALKTYSLKRELCSCSDSDIGLYIFCYELYGIDKTVVECLLKC